VKEDDVRSGVPHEEYSFFFKKQTMGDMYGSD